MKGITYSNYEGEIIEFPFSAQKKKALLFFDYETIHDAELLNKGCQFVFSSEEFVLFPICFKGYLSHKELPAFASNIPIQFRTVPFASEFSRFNLSESDFPILIIYNEKNELCGIGKNVSSIALIKCEDKINEK